MKNTAILLITIVLVLGITGLIAHLLAPETIGTLFYTNLISTMVLEVLFLLNVPFLTGKNLLTIRNTSIAVQVNFFILCEVAWMIVYSFFLSTDVEMNWYYSGILSILLLFAILISMVTMGGNTQAETYQQIQEETNKSKYTSSNLQSILAELQLNLKQKTYDEQLKDLKTLQTISDKIAAIPVKKYSETAIITEIHQELQNLLYKVKNEEANESTLTGMIENVNELISIKIKTL